MSTATVVQTNGVLHAKCPICGGWHMMIDPEFEKILLDSGASQDKIDGVKEQMIEMLGYDPYKVHAEQATFGETPQTYPSWTREASRERKRKSRARKRAAQQP